MTTFSVQAWNTANQTIFEEEQKLNKILSSNELDEIELNEIDQKIKKSYSILKSFSEELEKKMNDQAKGCWSASSKTVLKIQIGAAIGLLLMTGSNTYTLFGKDVVGKYVAYGLSTLAGWTTYIVDSYMIRVWFVNDAFSSLLNLNKDGIEQGRILKKLIKQIKKLRIETQSKKEEEPIPDIKIELKDPEKEISNFLKNYESLKHKSDEVYSRIIPLLIKKMLPDNDPLKVGLSKLEHSEIIDTTSIPSLPIDYMHSSPDFNKEDSSPKKSWRNEQFSRQESGELSSPSKLQADEHLYNWVNFHEQMHERFKIHQYLPYLITDRCRITKKGNSPIQLSPQELEEVKIDIK